MWSGTIASGSGKPSGRRKTDIACVLVFARLSGRGTRILGVIAPPTLFLAGGLRQPQPSTTRARSADEPARNGFRSVPVCLSMDAPGLQADPWRVRCCGRAPSSAQPRRLRRPVRRGPAWRYAKRACRLQGVRVFRCPCRRRRRRPGGRPDFIGTRERRA